MAKFKPPIENQLVIMLPISLQDQIVPSMLDHTISRLVDEHIDFSVFDARYNNDKTASSTGASIPQLRFFGAVLGTIGFALFLFPASWCAPVNWDCSNPTIPKTILLTLTATLLYRYICAR